MTNLAARKKQLGAFYTPQTIARFLVNWAVRGPGETVMDPGCGEAVFLLERFSTVTVVTFEERVFPDVLEDTAILLAESDGPAPGLRVIRVDNLDDLVGLGQSVSDAPVAPGAEQAQRWTRYLLPPDSLSGFEAIVETGDTVTLGELGAWTSAW